MSHNPVVEAVIYSIDLQKEQTILSSFGYFMQNFVVFISRRVQLRLGNTEPVLGKEPP